MQILVSEVGPRDGLQSIKRAMPTAIYGFVADAGLAKNFRRAASPSALGEGR